MDKATSIHDALWEWFLQCAKITKLYFNFGGTDDGDTAIATSGDTLIAEYIDGSQRRQYAFDLVRYLPFTETENDAGNVAMMEDVDAIIQWAEEQNAAGNLPELPDGYAAESVRVLDEYAGYVAAQDESRAKYMIPFAIDYIKGVKE